MGIRKSGRKRGPANLYERNGIFYGRITADGKERRKSLETSDRAEAERRLEKFLADNSRYHGTIRRTYREAMELWVRAGQWKPKTVETYGKLLATLHPLIGDLFWDQIDKALLLDLSEKLRQPKPGRTKPAGVATVNRYLSVISSIAEHVKDLPGWPEVNPVRLLPVKPRKEKRQHYVRPPAEHFDAYFARMRGTFGKLSRLALLTGARLDELVQLKSVDARNGRLQLWDTKSGFRIIPVSGEAQEIVTDLLGKNTELLFTTRNGGPYKRVSEMWREIRVRAQKKAQEQGYRLGHLRFHDLRHEYAIRYLESGGSIYTLQQLLGHSTIKQTEWYLRYLTPDQVAAVKK